MQKEKIQTVLYILMNKLVNQPSQEDPIIRITIMSNAKMLRNQWLRIYATRIDITNRKSELLFLNAQQIILSKNVLHTYQKQLEFDINCYQWPCIWNNSNKKCKDFQCIDNKIATTESEFQIGEDTSNAY